MCDYFMSDGDDQFLDEAMLGYESMIDAGNEFDTPFEAGDFSTNGLTVYKFDRLSDAIHFASSSPNLKVFSREIKKNCRYFIVTSKVIKLDKSSIIDYIYRNVFGVFTKVFCLLNESIMKSLRMVYLQNSTLILTFNEPLASIILLL